MRKLRFFLWIAVVLVAGLTVALFASDEVRDLAFGTSGGGEGVAAIGGPFEMVDHTGEPVTQDDFVGQPAAYFFGFTHCPDVCPTTLYELAGWMQDLEGEADNVQVVFVTVDPERDGPDEMARYVQSFGDRITGLTGTAEQVGEMTDAWRVHVRKVPLEDDEEGDYTVDHTASVFLMDSDNRFFGTIAFGEDGDSARAKLRRLARDG